MGLINDQFSSTLSFKTKTIDLRISRIKLLQKLKVKLIPLIPINKYPFQRKRYTDPCDGLLFEDHKTRWTIYSITRPGIFLDHKYFDIWGFDQREDLKYFYVDCNYDDDDLKEKLRELRNTISKWETTFL